MSKFSSRLQELRLEQGLSCLQLSKKIGTTDATIGRWEQGKQSPNIKYLELLAKFFDVSADYLIGLKDDSK